MRIFLSIIFGLSFLFVLAYLVMSLGLDVSVEVFNPDPSIYEDEDASSEFCYKYFCNNLWSVLI